MKTVPRPIRVNPETEKELFDFIEDKGGPKKAIKYLFYFYQNNKNLVNDIITQIKNEIDLSKISRTETRPKRLEDAALSITNDFNYDDELTSIFVK